MILRSTKKYRTRDGRPRMFYGCVRWPDCDGTHGAHPDGQPLGVPGNAETKEWRHKAHEVFDTKFAKMKRSRRYKKLQEIMGLGEEDAHIAKFNIEQCKELINLLEIQNKGSHK